MRTILIGLVVGFGVALLANLCTTVYLHRTLSHRALAVKSPVAFVFRVLLWMMTGIRQRQWVAVHRKHHAFTDVDGDPHSPVLLGWINVQIRNVALYRSEAKNPETVARYAKDLPQDRWDRWFFDHALFGLTLGTLLMVVALGLWAGLIAAFVHLNVYLATSAAVNAMAHHFGRKPYDNNDAGNLQWLAWLTAGEGLHNNHHAAPTSARLAHRRWEFDPGWWLILALRSVGLAKVRLNRLVLAARVGESVKAAT